MLIKDNTIARSRRDFLRAGMYAVGISAGLPALFQHVAAAEAQRVLGAVTPGEKHPERILVVLELSGGNDGLNTVVPYADDAYHRARSRIAVREREVLKLDDHFGLHPACTGLHRLVVHGCGYPNPNLSHFTAMEWWHTAVPHATEEYGWLGRFADAAHETPVENYIVNVAPRQALAVSSARHSPVVFKDPKQFGREGTDAQQTVFETFGKVYPAAGTEGSGNPSLDFVNTVSRAAAAGSARVRTACSEYRTLVDYGADNDLTQDLKKVAAMIAADMPTRIYYLGLGGFDTHAQQKGQHQLLLMYLSDALSGFLADLTRIGRADDVTVMAFTEFGRRVGENASGGTDHGTATPVFLLGNKVKPGFHGTPPSLTDLDQGNLKMTTDFRSVYATVLREWMGFAAADTVLKGTFPSVATF